MQTNDYYYIEVFTYDHIIKYQLLVLDKNTWNRKSVCKKKLK